MQNVKFDRLSKDQFHSMGRARLRAVANAMGWTKEQVDIRSNKGGPAVTGEVILHHDNVYVMLHSPCFGGGYPRLLVRMCKSRKDYSGGRNNYLSADLLNRPADCAKVLLAFMTANAGECQ
jgi:hypothetical protein